MFSPFYRFVWYLSNWFSNHFFAEFMLNGALLDFLRKEDGKGKVTFDNLISISGQVWNFFQIFLYMTSLIILSNCVNSRQIKSIPTLFTEDMHKIIQIKWNQSSSKVYHKLRRFSSLRLFVRAWFQNHLSPHWLKIHPIIISQIPHWLWPFP